MKIMPNICSEELLGCCKELNVFLLTVEYPEQCGSHYIQHFITSILNGETPRMALALTKHILDGVDDESNSTGT